MPEVLDTDLFPGCLGVLPVGAPRGCFFPDCSLMEQQLRCSILNFLAYRVVYLRNTSLSFVSIYCVSLPVGLYEHLLCLFTSQSLPLLCTKNDMASASGSNAESHSLRALLSNSDTGSSALTGIDNNLLLPYAFMPKPTNDIYLFLFCSH